MRLFRILSIVFFFLFVSCSKDNGSDDRGRSFFVESMSLDDRPISSSNNVIGAGSSLKITFNAAPNPQSLANGLKLIQLNPDQETSPDYTIDGNILTLTFDDTLPHLSVFRLTLSQEIVSQNGLNLTSYPDINLRSGVSDLDKFERVSKDELLTKVQEQTFKYFWDFAHPSGMIRERNTAGETVTTGGTGFGLMAIVVGADRGFVSQTEAKNRVQQIVDFLKTADTFHGAFSHWYNGTTGRTMPFSEMDNGADLVETSLLFQGLIAAMEYFDDPLLRTDITALFEAIEWPFFQNNQNVLTWHWSENFGWDINLKIQGWNESLITYVLAASSPTFGISKAVYDEGWARNGDMRNGKTFYGINLPLGEDYGGPLFLSQYSFLGIDPNGLTDQYASYSDQVRAHTLVNRQHAIENPNNFYGYSADCWGFTASDDVNGYAVHSPTQDNGVITPTAAISSMAFTPDESFSALEFFYYKLGDKIWGEYGFKDAFSLQHLWFANSYIAIDQGPIIIGIENYRSGLIWDLFMKNQWVKNGLVKLGFSSPKI